MDLSWSDQPVRDYFLVFTGNETTTTLSCVSRKILFESVVKSFLFWKEVQSVLS